MDGITLYRQWKDPEWYNNCYFSDTKPIPDYLGSTQDLICEDGDWQTLGREKQSAFFVKHKKELDKIIGNCKYGRLVFNKCGNDIYGISCLHISLSGRPAPALDDNFSCCAN